MELTLVKTPGGMLAPYSDEDVAILAKIKVGSILTSLWRKKRNPLFHRKFFALLKVGFDHWEPFYDHLPRGVHEIRKNFEQFRYSVTIQAGYYDAYYQVDGSVRLEPRSIRFDRMGQDEFEKLYSDVVDVILHRVLSNYTREDLDKVVETVMRFT